MILAVLLNPSSGLSRPRGTRDFKHTSYNTARLGRRAGCQ